ncbi:MAG: hypothetical protein LBS16_03495 [Prevotellaceae bacterium]|nr:hypothetical protein [Prevotellaceae bacterium]
MQSYTLFNPQKEADPQQRITIKLTCWTLNKFPSIFQRVGIYRNLEIYLVV